MWWRITLIIFLTLIVAGSIAAYIVYSLFIDQDHFHIVRGSCAVIYCVFNRFTYQWPDKPYYRAYYNGTPIGCPRSLSCGYDDRDPINTFGGWTHNGSELICINGACNIEIGYSEWYLTFIILFVAGGIGLIATIINYIKYRKQKALEEFNRAFTFPNDIIS